MAEAGVESVFYDGVLSAMQLSVPGRDNALGVRALPQLWMAIAVLVGWLLVLSRRAALVVWGCRLSFWLPIGGLLTIAPPFFWGDGAVYSAPLPV